LDGAWVVESIEIERGGTNLDNWKSTRWEIAGNWVIGHFPGEDARRGGGFGLEIDPTTSPFAVEIVQNDRKVKLHGICEVKDNTLRICWSPKGVSRPREFELTPGSGQWLMTLKRVGYRRIN